MSNVIRPVSCTLFGVIKQNWANAVCTTSVFRTGSDTMIIKRMTLPRQFISLPAYYMEPGQQVGIATGYGLDDRGVGVRVQVGSRIFCSPRRTDRLWGPPNLLSNWYRRLFRRG
jgi:hypothetical protein